MADHKELQKAIRQMADGSKSGFHTFYLCTVRYIYSSALLLYGSPEDACSFVIDFYQYLYLHLPEYDRTQDLEKWISRLLLERFKQLSIGKTMQQPSIERQMSSGTQRLPKNEQTRIWRMLEMNIHFPPEPSKHIGHRVMLLSALFLLLLLLSFRYAPALLEKLHTAVSEFTEDASGDEPSATDEEMDDLPESDVSPADELQTDIDDSDVTDALDDSTDIPEMEAPSMDVPEMEAPSMDVPEMEAPSMDVPEMEPPSMDVPEMEAPSLNL